MPKLPPLHLWALFVSDILRHLSIQTKSHSYTFAANCHQRHKMILAQQLKWLNRGFQVTTYHCQVCCKILQLLAAIISPLNGNIWQKFRIYSWRVGIHQWNQHLQSFTCTNVLWSKCSINANLYKSLERCRICNSAANNILLVDVADWGTNGCPEDAGISALAPPSRKFSLSLLILPRFSLSHSIFRDSFIVNDRNRFVRRTRTQQTQIFASMQNIF